MKKIFKKIKLLPKRYRLLIRFKGTQVTKGRIESYRTTSLEKAKKIVSKRNRDNIISAVFGDTYEKVTLI